MDIQAQAEKMQMFFRLCNKWLYLKNSDIKLSSHAVFARGKTIGVYGLGDIGKRLIEELETSRIPIHYAVDKNAVLVFGDFDVYTTQEELPPVDIMIVTPVYYYEEICRAMQGRDIGSFISLNTIIEDLWEEAGKQC